MKVPPHVRLGRIAQVALNVAVAPHASAALPVSVVLLDSAVRLDSVALLDSVLPHAMTAQVARRASALHLDQKPAHISVLAPLLAQAHIRQT